MDLARLNRLGACETVAAIASGRTTCEAVVRACLERIAERDPEVRAFRFVDPDAVIAEARLRDRSGRRGPLLGVPFSVKDIIETADMPTEYGSPIYAGYRPGADAACVALARKAGAVLVGKAETCEFANFHPSRTRNPLDLARTPGGSSSGSAASVADFMVALSVGTQTSGSTVRPAAYCGVFGYQPTYGELRVMGVKESVGSLDTLGLIARSIEDVALFRDVLLGVDPRPIPDPPRAPRIGFCRTHLWSLLEPSTQTLFENAASALARAGARVEDVTLPPEFDGIPDAHRTIAGFEFARNYAYEIENHWERISETLRAGRIADGLACSYGSYREAFDFAERCRARFAAVVEPYDALLTACATGEAPLGHTSTGNAKLCLTWTTLHVPAVSVPAFRGPAGMPISPYLVGRRYGDRALFAVAKWLERALG